VRLLIWITKFAPVFNGLKKCCLDCVYFSSQGWPVFAVANILDDQSLARIFLVESLC
jgi:hypothetical protein